jgi:uncharacterized protein (TIGR03066 family)
VPADLETICLKAMAKRPEDRYASCQELADDLRRWQQGEPVSARPLRGWERLSRWVRKEPSLAAAAALLVAVLVLSFLLIDSARREAERKAAAAQAAEEQVLIAKDASLGAVGTAAEERKKALALQSLLEEERKKAEALRARAEQLEAEAARGRKDADEAPPPTTGPGPPDPPQPPIPAPMPAAEVDPKKLVGKWRVEGIGAVTEFTAGGKYLVTVGAGSTFESTYTLEGDKLSIGPKTTWTVTRLTDSELVTQDAKGKSTTRTRVRP